MMHGRESMACRLYRIDKLLKCADKMKQYAKTPMFMMFKTHLESTMSNTCTMSKVTTLKKRKDVY